MPVLPPCAPRGSAGTHHLRNPRGSGGVGSKDIKVVKDYVYIYSHIYIYTHLLYVVLQPNSDGLQLLAMASNPRSDDHYSMRLNTMAMRFKTCFSCEDVPAFGQNPCLNFWNATSLSQTGGSTACCSDQAWFDSIPQQKNSFGLPSVLACSMHNCRFL